MAQDRSAGLELKKLVFSGKYHRDRFATISWQLNVGRAMGLRPISDEAFRDLTRNLSSDTIQPLRTATACQKISA
ncbi:hypothetical protein [Rhodobacteraceae bacterium DSL-40]|uniref:hypothetical protein n=1 Tax=Amaricoccus sp. B4 TaxID=3368557 RepID=UPI000DAF0659